MGSTTFSGPVRVGVKDDVTKTTPVAFYGHGTAGRPFAAGDTPSSGALTIELRQTGPLVELILTMSAMRVAVVDGAASGAHGSFHLGTWIEQRLKPIQSTFNGTIAGDGTTVTATAVLDVAVGTVAIAAAAETLGGTATHVNIVGKMDVTLSAGAGVLTGGTHGEAVFDGSGTPVEFHLNVAGTAATVAAGTGHVDLTGVIRVVCLMLGDD